MGAIYGTLPRKHNNDVIDLFKENECDKRRFILFNPSDYITLIKNM
uniref:Uncharacterized protein n=1 Tax=viral metagenome TaxID=1070528 RepID=A0A6C0BJ22_9ZZZZ